MINTNSRESSYWIDSRLSFIGLKLKESQLNTKYLLS